ncbi:RagB/SusD family nutrient uptake outer membrane protein [Saccharicrinis sp. FJH54]|uniref:RagB/SusD family nutrient uptake outer membrane protein n=1 Tax=Saccharicrinis sp. FJH54 TaxID=3344665 RepID=UPI0035D43DB9
MKNIKLYIIALGALILSSCSDSFLDSEPIIDITTENFYKTKKDAELAVVGCYDGIQILYSSGQALPVISEVMADQCFGGTGNNDSYGYQLLDEFDLSRSPADIDMLNENWKAYYKAIYRCNVLLQKMNQINWEGDTAYMNNIEAQARFLRAYAYFDMVRMWEKVPLLTEPQNGNIPQSPADDTYKQIAKDLLFAAEYGSETVEPGRVNRWAAKAYLARVFLYYTGYYNKTDLAGTVSKAEALQGLEDVIGSEAYGLVEEYKNLWPAASTEVNEDQTGTVTTYAGKDNKETVFAIKYNITSDYNGNVDGNHWMVMFGLRVQNFTPPYGKGWGACTVLPEFYNAFEDGDARKVASIIAINEEGVEFDNGDQREYTGYTSKKYSPLSTYVLVNDEWVLRDVAEANSADNFMIGQFQDYVVMRYADVLLMAAELGSANAQTYFDEVRSRAGLDSKEVSKANIMEERKFEFAFEGIRYWDLLRQGVDVLANAVAENTTVLNGGVESGKVILKSNVTPKKGLLMIPQQQITRSGGVLIQNDGWK